MRWIPGGRPTTGLLSTDCLLWLRWTLSCFDTWTLTCWVGHLAWINIACHRLTTTYQREETQEMMDLFSCWHIGSGFPRPAGGGGGGSERHVVWSCVHSFTVFIQPYAAPIKGVWLSFTVTSSSAISVSSVWCAFAVTESLPSPMNPELEISALSGSRKHLATTSGWYHRTKLMIEI